MDRRLSSYQIQKNVLVSKRYQEEIGKDYKRIVLYLCTTDDMKMANEQEFLQEYESPDSECSLPATKKTLIEGDEALAKRLQSQFDFEIQDSKKNEYLPTSINMDCSCDIEPAKEDSDHEDVDEKPTKKKKLGVRVPREKKLCECDHSEKKLGVCVPREKKLCECDHREKKLGVCVPREKKLCECDHREKKLGVCVPREKKLCECDHREKKLGVCVPREKKLCECDHREKKLGVCVPREKKLCECDHREKKLGVCVPREKKLCECDHREKKLGVCVPREKKLCECDHREKELSESVIQKLQRELKELKDSANITLVDNAIASLQQLIARPAGLFDPYAVLAALEQVVNVDKNYARSGRFNVILRQCQLDRNFIEFVKSFLARQQIVFPFHVVEGIGQYDAECNVVGGGPTEFPAPWNSLVEWEECPVFFISTQLLAVERKMGWVISEKKVFCFFY
ncbi:hypothetical protein QZH41_000227 [Actinostola sp. cb2023]|nr:hypothetical protein QZH41_000227 [Actinostola sp. cb2023]